MSDENDVADKNVGGRPPHVPNDDTRRTVELMAGFGNPEAHIALVLKISEPTLRKHYEDELERGFIVLHSSLQSQALRIATFRPKKTRKNEKGGIISEEELAPPSQCVTMLQFLLECRFGWSKYAPAPNPKPPAAEKRGKKEQADLDAKTAGQGSRFADFVRH